MASHRAEKKLINRVAPAFAAAILTWSIAWSQHQFPSQQKINVIMDDAMKTSDLPAVVAVAVDREGNLATYTYGKAIWTGSQPVTTDHIFRIYSMTKLLTSIAALQLVEAGKLSLDMDVSVVLPEINEPPILVNGQTMPGKNKITLRHLLTHTSGFGYGFTDAALAKYTPTNKDHPVIPRRFESGTQFLYGTSTDWVGKLVEKSSGMNLENYFRAHISGPLKMDHTWYNLPDSLYKYIVSRGSRGPDGKSPLTETPGRVPAARVTEFGGGSGLFSSPADYTRLLQCLLNKGQLKGVRILEEATVDEMSRNQIGDVVMNMDGAYFDPATCCNLNGMITRRSKWGLAWLIDNEPRSYGRKAGTVTWGGLMNTYFYIDFQSGIAASIYTQHLPFNHQQTIRLFEKFSEAVYGH